MFSSSAWRNQNTDIRRQRRRLAVTCSRVGLHGVKTKRRRRHWDAELFLSCDQHSSLHRAGGVPHQQTRVTHVHSRDGAIPPLCPIRHHTFDICWYRYESDKVHFVINTTVYIFCLYLYIYLFMTVYIWGHEPGYAMSQVLWGAFVTFDGSGYISHFSPISDPAL